MKIFVTGVGGQLGFDVMNELISRGHEAVAQIFMLSIKAELRRRHGHT